MRIDKIKNIESKLLRPILNDFEKEYKKYIQSKHGKITSTYLNEIVTDSMSNSNYCSKINELPQDIVNTVIEKNIDNIINLYCIKFIDDKRPITSDDIKIRINGFFQSRNYPYLNTRIYSKKYTEEDFVFFISTKSKSVKDSIWCKCTDEKKNFIGYEITCLKVLVQEIIDKVCIEFFKVLYQKLESDMLC